MRCILLHLILISNMWYRRLASQPAVMLMTSWWMNFAIIIQWIYFTIWKKKKKNCHLYKYHIKSLQYHIKILQKEFAKKSNTPWIWRFIYGHKLPYIKKTRKKKQVCGAACLNSRQLRSHSPKTSVRHTFLTMFLSSYHPEFLWVININRRDVYAKRSRSKCQGQRGQIKFWPNLGVSGP